MAELWRKNSAGLFEALVLLPSSTPLLIALGGEPCAVVQWMQGAARRFGVFVPPSVVMTVSGQPVVGQFACLEHQDELVVDSDVAYLSTESLPVVSLYGPVSSPGPRCPVCKTHVTGQVVVCPRCQRTYCYRDASDEHAEKHCWTFRPQCLCGQSTALDGSQRWRPEGAAEDARS